MKIAISGKGGTGKTTLSALLVNTLKEKGYRVLAVDADPDANLAGALGFPHPEEIVPITEMEELIHERTGAKPGTAGGFFTLNPRVDDIPDQVCREQDGVRLMVMGEVKKGGGGCICPESALLKALMQHLLLQKDEVVVIDMEAGVEHLGRGVAGSVDSLLVVVEPGQRSIDTARRVKKLAADIGLHRIGIVGNKVREKSELDFIKENLGDIPFLGYLPYSKDIFEADLHGRPLSHQVGDIEEKVEEILKGIGIDPK
ncbi:MAG: AAA family ATPase [Deltaproteobacteria bacterium]|nr:MAG: AAA family ATPase [Deltaproteobacteria bacterium]